MKLGTPTWKTAGARGMAALLAVVMVLHLAPAIAAPGDIFSTPAPVIGADPPHATDLKVGDTSVSTQTGALQYAYPITVPPGRNGASPSLALSYSSQGPLYGGPAAGWSVNVPRIVEDTSKGRLRTHTPGADVPLDDRFVSTLAGGRALVPVPEPFLAGDVLKGYRAQADSSFARYERMVTSALYRWRMRSTDGTVLYFGDTSNAGTCPLSDGYAPLTRSVDQFGNEVNYFYSMTSRECLLTRISWGRNANAGMTDFAAVQFNTQRADVCPGGFETGSQMDYKTGVPITTGSNFITSIVVTAWDPMSGPPVQTVHTRQITLGYSNSSTSDNTESCTGKFSPVRLLTSIQESAWGIDSPRVDLPPVTFKYGSPLVDQTDTPNGVVPPWQDTLRPTTNLAWGFRRPANDDRWPSVEAMMIDIDGDGLLDRVQNAQTTTGSTTMCRASVQRGIPGATLSYGPVQYLSWGSTSNNKMPMLRWNGAQEPNPGQVNVGSTQAAPGFPYFESCALNGQVTYFHNSHASNVCHDNVTACVPEPSGNGGSYCPIDGHECGGNLDASPRTYLAYRWMDMDGDSLPDLVAGVHGSIDRYDIVQGNDFALNGAYEPALFGTVPLPGGMPACTNLAQSCKKLGHTAMNAKANCDAPGPCTFDWPGLNSVISTAPDDECEMEIGSMSLAKIGTGDPASTGNPSAHNAPREPYKACGNLYPWFIFKNRGNGNFADIPSIKYQPVPLESDNGDSALTGGVSATHHGLIDIDGDGLVDGVAQARDVDPSPPIKPWWWFAWLNDGSGQLGPTRYIWPGRTYTLGYVNGYGTQLGWPASSAGLLDINADGLMDHWAGSGSTADVAYNSGTLFRVGGFPHVAGELTLQGIPANENRVVSVPPINGFSATGHGWAKVRVVDIDSDGRQDIVNSSNEIPTWINFNNSGQFLSPQLMPAGFIGAARIVIATDNQPAVGSESLLWHLNRDLLDLDGDGLPESVSFDGTFLQRQRHSLASGPPRLMTSVDNGRGAKTDVVYSSMHDPNTVVQHPEVVVAGRPQSSPQAQWVVKSLTTTDQFPSPLVATTTYKYDTPIHLADDDGKFSLRGFAKVTTTSPTLSRTVHRYSYTPDWSGRLASTTVMPAPSEGTNDARTIDRTTWEAKQLFTGAVTTYHATVSEHFTCANGQVDPADGVAGTQCTDVTAPGHTLTTSTLTALTAPGSSTSLLWQETGTLLQSGTGQANGDRTTTSTFALKADANTYRLRRTGTLKEVRSAGAPTVYGKTVTTWDSSNRVPVMDELWFNTTDLDRAITTRTFDMATGNLTQETDPRSNSISYEYDTRKLFVAAQNQVYTHYLEFGWEYGTGTKLLTRGPQVASCFPATCPGQQDRDENKIRVDGLGRMIERYASVNPSATLDYFALRKVETNLYEDNSAPANAPTFVTHQAAIKESGGTISYSQDKTELDGHGRPIRMTQYALGSAAADQVTTYHYNAEGTLHDVTLPNPSANDATVVMYEYTFDSLGRAKSVRRPDASLATDRSGVNIDYDGATTTATEVVGAAGGQVAVTRTTNDKFGRLSTVEEEYVASPLAFASTQYLYDANDNVSQITDPEGKVTTLSHDFASRRGAISRINGGTTRTWTYEYDKTGNLSAQTTPCSGLGCPANYITSTAYDAFNRPISRLIAPRDVSGPDRTLFGADQESMIWDLNANGRGQLVQWRAFGGGTEALLQWRAHDPQGRTTLHWQSFNRGGFSQVRSNERTYYLGGAPQTTSYGDLVMNGTRQTVSKTGLDARGLPSTIAISVDNGATYPPSATVTQTRNVAGLVTKRSGATGAGGTVDSLWTYDKLARVEKQAVGTVAGGVSTAVAQQTLTYNGNDDPKTLRHVLGTASKTFTYTYDLRHQLTNVVTSTSTFFGAVYEYGLAGRFAKAKETRSGTVPALTDLLTRDVDYVYGGADAEQVTALTNGKGGARFATFTYDDSGNMLTRCLGATYTPTCAGEMLEYLYDGKDQLRRVTRKLNNVVTGAEEYWYDADGNRTHVRKLNASGGTTELVWYLDETEHHISPASPTTAEPSTEPRAFAHVGAGTPVARVARTGDVTAPIEYQFHGLADCTLAAVAQSNGAVNATFSYAPFGEVLEGTDVGGVNGHARRFNDKVSDALSDQSTLLYYGARYYDRSLLGWTQIDPVSRFFADAAGGAPRNALLYTAFKNNPLRYRDPDGREDPAAGVMEMAGGWIRSGDSRVAAAGILVYGFVAVMTLGDPIDFDGIIADAAHAKAVAIRNVGVTVGSASATLTVTLDRITARPIPMEASHRKNKRESNRQKHEDGDRRRKRDKGGEKGDSSRRRPRMPPPGHKGPWPPRPPRPSANFTADDRAPDGCITPNNSGVVDNSGGTEWPTVLDQPNQPNLPVEPDDPSGFNSTHGGIEDMLRQRRAGVGTQLQ